MGFKIHNNVVYTDHTTDNFAITEPRNKYSPCFGTFQSHQMDLFSIFYRKGGANRKEPGDNCPFLYALKGRDDLTLDKNALKNLRPNFYKIIEHLYTLIIERYGKVNFIIPMPSSHPYSILLAKILQRKIFQDALVLDNFLLKKNNSEIYQEIKESNISPKNINRLLMPVKRAIREDIPFSVSSFPIQLRSAVSPLKINTSIVTSGTYLLVDDLTATGSTFFSAKKAILSSNKHATITAVSLFSPVNNRFRDF